MTSTDEPVQPKGKAIATPYAKSKGSHGNGGAAVTGYRPMTLADLAGRLARTEDGKSACRIRLRYARHRS
jgi:hypothetical protein